VIKEWNFKIRGQFLPESRRKDINFQYSIYQTQDVKVGIKGSCLVRGDKEAGLTDLCFKRFTEVLSSTFPLRPRHV
jgi:hypothetical protein